MSRTLAGHLEDFDLDEVVRVIALSGRSGLLTVESPEGDAELMFQRGRLVSGRRAGHSTTVGELLVRAGVIEQHELVDAGKAPLEQLLDKRPGHSPAEEPAISRADRVLSEQLKALTMEVLLYRTGSFAFRVSDESAPPRRYPGDTSVGVARGLDAEELAREAKRRREQQGKDPLRPLQSGARRTPASQQVELFVVDDDGQFLAALDRQAAAVGVEVQTFESSRGAVDALDELADDSAPRVLVADLVMPRANGRGILGGLEVLRRAHERGCAERVFLALDESHPDAEGIARKLGAAGVLSKPQASNGSLPNFAPFLNPLLERLGRPLLVDEPIDLVAQLRDELGEEGDEWSADLGGGEVKPTLGVLKELLSALNQPTFDEEIPLLVLRFASAFFSRGAIFHVHRERGVIGGVGGYGIGSADAGRTVHSIQLPFDADTVFTRSVREGEPVHQPYFESEWNTRLVSALGGPRPRDVYTAPIFSAGGLEALLYADNALDGRAFPDVTLLEIFLQQSGAALERWAMKLRLDSLAPARAPATDNANGA